MNPNGENRWTKMELMLLRSYLFFHLSDELIAPILQRLIEIGHKLSLW